MFWYQQWLHAKCSHSHLHIFFNCDFGKTESLSMEEGVAAEAAVAPSEASIKLITVDSCDVGVNKILS